jgi:hypothetical protein
VKDVPCLELWNLRKMKLSVQSKKIYKTFSKYKKISTNKKM